MAETAFGPDRAPPVDTTPPFPAGKKFGRGRELASASPWALIRRRFARHRLAAASFYLLVVLYLLAIGAEFFAPHSPRWRDLTHIYCPPQVPRFSFAQGLH